MSKAQLTKGDLSKVLGISLNTLNTWIKAPTMIKLKDIITLSGLFGISCEELVYILTRNKPQVKTKNVKSGVFYIDNIRSKHK